MAIENNENEGGGSLIIDRSARAHFTLAPNALLRGRMKPELSVHACWLFLYFQSVASGGSGQCWQSTRTIAAATRMSVGMVVKAKAALAEAKLIRITKRHEESDLIEIADIWTLNAKLSQENPVHEVNEGVHEVNQRRLIEEDLRKKKKGRSRSRELFSAAPGICSRILSDLPDEYGAHAPFALALREFLEGRLKKQKGGLSISTISRLRAKIETATPAAATAALIKSHDSGWTGIFPEPKTQQLAEVDLPFGY